MDTVSTVSITLPSALLAKAEEIAQRENRTLSELFKDTLLRYIVAEHFPQASG